MTITQVGFIGLGNMGSPMAAHLVDAGFALTVSDAAPGVTEGFVAEHPAATAATGPESFATVQALILMLPTSEIVEDVLEREQVADALPPGCLVIDMSSSEPLRTRALAARLRAKGLSMLDAPVSGGVRGARAARLSVLVGGSQDDLARATPLLNAMAATIIRVGDIGAGHAAKALNNLVSAATMSITVEAARRGRGIRDRRRHDDHGAEQLVRTEQHEREQASPVHGERGLRLRILAPADGQGRRPRDRPRAGPRPSG